MTRGSTIGDRQVEGDVSRLARGEAEQRDIYIYIYMYVCMYVCMHVCMYMYIYIYIYTYVYALPTERPPPPSRTASIS